MFSKKKVTPDADTEVESEKAKKIFSKDKIITDKNAIFVFLKSKREIKNIKKTVKEVKNDVKINAMFKLSPNIRNITAKSDAQLT